MRLEKWTHKNVSILHAVVSTIILLRTMKLSFTIKIVLFLSKILFLTQAFIAYRMVKCYKRTLRIPGYPWTRLVWGRLMDFRSNRDTAALQACKIDVAPALQLNYQPDSKLLNSATGIKRINIEKEKQCLSMCMCFCTVEKCKVKFSNFLWDQYAGFNLVRVLLPWDIERQHWEIAPICSWISLTRLGYIGPESCRLTTVWCCFAVDLKVGKYVGWFLHKSLNFEIHFWLVLIY